MSEATWDGGIPLTKSENKLVERLSRNHKDIRLLGGPAALEREAEKNRKQEERQAWVEKHGLACFKCGGTLCQWANGGRNKWGRLYVICVPCVRRPRESEGAA